MKRITILITEDHQMLRETWSCILNADDRFNVIAECGSGEEAIEKSRRLQPDVVLMDINLPGMSGIEAVAQIRKYSPGTRIVGVSMHKQPVYARKMLQEGAMGYVSKTSSGDEMIKAILEVHANRKYICDDVKTILSHQLLSDDVPNGISSLSGREIEIIQQIKRGLSSKEIATALGISLKTVEVHRYNILKKLGLKNTAAMINYINQSELAVLN